MDDASRLVAAIDEGRLWRRHLEIAQCGATGRGGVNRQALTPEETAAPRLLLGWAKTAGYTTRADAIGNLFIRRAGADADEAPVVAGSHLDSQPTGGNFDGVYGVLAALEVLDAATDIGLRTRRALEAVAWCNEEGSRFQPSTMGSNVFAGAMPLDAALQTRDREGDTVADSLQRALAELSLDAEVPLGAPMSAYLEAHIEQGPVLEAEGRTVGIVSGVQGLRWFQVDVRGEEGHAGTMPQASRRDALATAITIAAALQTLMRDDTDTVRFTVGRFEVAPNSPNTIPGHVLFTVDFRHPEAAVLRRLGDQIADLCLQHAGRCRVEITETLNTPPTAFDSAIRDRIRTAAQRQGVSHMDIVSGATHDAKSVAHLCPTGMIFVPCAGGLSHNEAERATSADLAAGARVLAEVMLELAND